MLKKLFLVFLLLLFWVPATQAIPTEPKIIFELVDDGSTEIDNISCFTRTGNFSEIFHNNMRGINITDFHFEFDWDGLVWGYGMPFFDDFIDNWDQSSNHHNADFYMGDNGTGIPYCTYFRITTIGFEGTTEFKICPTVPEPSTLFLLGVGLLCLVGARRNLKDS